MKGGHTFAHELGVPIERLLGASTFEPTCQQPAADGLQSGKCCDACDGRSCHEWLRWHNRLRAKVGTDAGKGRDAERLGPTSVPSERRRLPRLPRGTA